MNGDVGCNPFFIVRTDDLNNLSSCLFLLRRLVETSGDNNLARFCLSCGTTRDQYSVSDP